MEHPESSDKQSGTMEQRPSSDQASGKKLGTQILSWSSWLLMILNTSGLLLCWPLVVIVNAWYMSQMSSSLELELPVFTVWFCSISWWLWGLIFLLPTIGLILLQVLLPRHGLLCVVNVVISLLVGIFAVLWFIALFLPVWRLMDELQ